MYRPAFLCVLLVLAPALACSGEEDGRSRSEPLPEEPDGTGGTGGVPPPVVHAPPVQLGVELLGPELDAPGDVRDLAVDPAGGLWLAAADGLYMRQPGLVFFQRLPGAKSPTGAPPVSVAALDARRAVVGYADGPAQLVDLDGGTITVTPLALEGPVPRMEPTGFGAVLAGTAAGLGRIGAGGIVSGPEPLPAPSSAIWAIAAAGPDVWVGDEHRVARLGGALAGPLDPEPSPSVDLVPDVSDWVVALASCPNGELWASALGSGIFRLSPSGEVLEHLRAAEVLPQDHVLSLACDLDGTIWIGTSWGGLARRTPSGAWLYHSAAAGLPGDSIRRILVVPDGLGGRTLWIATEGGAAAYSGP